MVWQACWCWLLIRSVGWGSNGAGTLLYLVPSPSTPTYTVKTQDSKHYDSHHWPHSPLTKQIDFCFFYCVSGLWVFCQALFLTKVFSNKVWSCHELDPWNIIHIPGFITHNFLFHDYGSFSNISGMNLDGSYYKQFSNLYRNLSCGYPLHFTVNLLW